MHDGRRAWFDALERGKMSRYIALIVLVAMSTAARSDHTHGVCKLAYCACAPAAHPSWTTVNCTVPRDKKLDILEGDLPETTTDITITGAEAVMFGPNSLTRLKDARQIHVSGPGILLMSKFTAVNLNVVSVYLEIEDIELVRIEEKTFSTIKGPLSVSIKNCDFVSIEGEAFSWLLTMSITHVRKMELGKGSFMLDPTAANVGEHGPGMSIELKNTTIPELPPQSFGSSAAKILMEYVEIYAIRSSAFSANTYNIVMAVNCSFHLIEEEAFAPKSLINNLHFIGCKIHHLTSKALQSAVSNLNISQSKLDNVNTGAINTTVASVAILDTEFHIFEERGFEVSSWNKLQMERNSFDELPPNAIAAPGASIHELIFIDNEIETIHSNSLGFIGQAESHSNQNIAYRSNYFGQACHCNITDWLAKGLDAPSGDPYISESYCTVNEFFARCFNVPEQNMQIKKFIDAVCANSMTIHCESYKAKEDGDVVEIKNPRFPHKGLDEPALSDRDKKVIGIVIVTCLICVIIAMFVSLIKCMKRRGYCVNIKNFVISSNSSCGSFCDRLCTCGVTSELDNARSISQLSVNEYSERHRLNEPRMQEIVQESTLQDEPPISTSDKTTQTLPEELTKELLDNLKERLDSPENYVEAREMIEHLYEITKMEESLNNTAPTLINVEENIYELPYQQTMPRIGRNKKKMISVGTRTPSLDKLTPLSPYNRETALAHEYFEPKDVAIHLYAEIANSDKEKRQLLGTMPDVIAEQAVPRGPYLRAVREKLNPNSTSNVNNNSFGTPVAMSTIKSTTSNSSGKMLNRPLPEKPSNVDLGEGTSFKHG